MPAADFVEYHLHDKDLRMFVDLYRALRTGRNFVVTEKGRLDWCPESCQKGDRIIVLAGGKVRFILRQLEKGDYQLLGDAYVHGIIDGEAVDEMKRTGGDWESIALA